MKNSYPIRIKKGTDFMLVDIIDFDAITQGENLTDAIEMARDAIGLLGIDMEDDGKTLPTPSDISAIALSDGEIVTLVDVDFTEYRRKNDMRSVKKNCTIPSWLNAEAEKAHINFSAVLQDALRQRLNL